MPNLTKLAAELARTPDDCLHQPLRCRAALALVDAAEEIERLKGRIAALEEATDS